jgi:hypothetical protein
MRLTERHCHHGKWACMGPQDSQGSAVWRPLRLGHGERRSEAPADSPAETHPSIGLRTMNAKAGDDHKQQLHLGSQSSVSVAKPLTVDPEQVLAARVRCDRDSALPHRRRVEELEAQIAALHVDSDHSPFVACCAILRKLGISEIRAAHAVLLS